MDPTPTEPIVSARGLRHHYGDTEVLRGIDIDVHPGQLLAVMGPSGSGKSTLLHMLSGMDRPSSGRIVLDGVELSGLDPEALARLRLQRVGFVFQQVHLLRSLSLLDNVVLPAYLARTAPRAELTRRARELMDELGVEHLAARAVSEASGGQLQRVAICRALLTEPSVLFADEPTGALDSTAGQEVMTVLRALADQGTAVVVITHDPRVAERADRVVRLEDGRILWQRTAPLATSAAGEPSPISA